MTGPALLYCTIRITMPGILSDGQCSFGAWPRLSDPESMPHQNAVFSSLSRTERIHILSAGMRQKPDCPPPADVRWYGSPDRCAGNDGPPPPASAHHCPRTGFVLCVARRYQIRLAPPEITGVAAGFFPLPRSVCKCLRCL